MIAAVVSDSGKALNNPGQLRERPTGCSRLDD
jgi:hypothetical protein